MSDSPPDDERAASTEAQMRRALGLDRNPPAPTERAPPISKLGDPHAPRRRQFVRDGDVPVTVIHRHQNPNTDSTNQLDAARQAIRSQAAARERAERLLEQTQATVRDLQTKLAHAHLDKDAAQEAVRSVTVARDTTERILTATEKALAAEKAARDRLERLLRDDKATIQDQQRKLDGARAELAAERRARQNAEGIGKMPVEARVVAASANRIEAVPMVRRPVGRPRKIAVVQMVEKPVAPSGKAPGRSVTVKAKGSAKSGRPAQRPAGKPVKWWLTGR